MSIPAVDILMITYNRPRYTQLSLQRLLDASGDHSRVWVWHNGDDPDTLEVVHALREHPRFFRFHHSRENKKLWEPTNWFWEQSDGSLVGKVDDDCLVPDGWIQVLGQAHMDVPEFGTIACWHYREEDYVPDLAERKTRTYAGGHQLMQNCWTGGSGYLMKRRCIEQLGLLPAGQSFPGYCIQLAARGWVNGWYFPFLYQDHMDDPRSEHTNLKTDEDFQRLHPLTAKTFDVKTLEDWLEFNRQDARSLQRAGTDPRQYTGWRAKLRRLAHRRNR